LNKDASTDDLIKRNEALKNYNKDVNNLIALNKNELTKAKNDE